MTPRARAISMPGAGSARLGAGLSPFGGSGRRMQTEARRGRGVSVEGDAQAEVEHVLLPAGGVRGAAHFDVADRAEVEVSDRRDRDVPAHADVVSQPGDEADPRPVRRRAVHLPERGEPDATFEEEPGRHGGIIVDRRGDVAQLVRDSAVGLGPRVDLTAEQHPLGQRAAELQEAREASSAIERTASVARGLRRPIPEPEANPEPLARLRMLRPRRGGGETGEPHKRDENPSYATHSALLYGVETPPRWGARLK